MGSLFSSPSKSASSASTGSTNTANQEISDLINYYQGAQTKTRNQIANLGANPYFGAAQSLSPSNYQTNPNDTATFGNVGPGTTGSQNTLNSITGPGTGTVTATVPPSLLPPNVQPQPIAQNPTPSPLTT